MSKMIEVTDHAKVYGNGVRSVGPIRELVIHGWDCSKILPGFAVIVGLTILLMLISQMIFQRATTD